MQAPAKEQSKTSSAILQWPDNRLKSKCIDAKFKEALTIGAILEKEWKLYQAEHRELKVVGMAAPQIGVTKNVFIAFDELFINPKIVFKGLHPTKMREACCSLGAKTFVIERPREVTLVWTNKLRQIRRYTFEDGQACIIQHEYDHLLGVLLRDKVKP